jgi:tRNA-dihydrouridine synthase B
VLAIKNLHLKNPVMQSPMAGCTDLAFRVIARRHGLELAMTEMISAEALVRTHKKTLSLLLRSPDDQPTGCQIVGANPETMAKAAEILEPMGFALIDINCGCPVPKITGQNAGSALMKDPKRAKKIFSSVTRAVREVPVTVKMRTGFTDPSGKEALHLAQLAEACGLSAITVHGRTRAQGYSGKADWNVIKMVKRAVTIPVFGNGDIFTARDARRIKKDTGCDGIAIGRGALGNPWIYENIRSAFGHKKIHRPSLVEIRRTVREHLRLNARFDGEKVAHLKARHIASWYIKGLPGASRLREKINRSRSLDEIIALVESHDS